MSKQINATIAAVLMGGADLEMAEIAIACREAGVVVIDAGLSWGAKLSAYAANLATIAANGGGTVVAVELEVDCEVPCGIDMVVVDHHGPRSSEPASILQVLSMLGVKPTRWQLLVAANDSGYIPGLVEMGATPEEVEYIRSVDRHVQGVSVDAERSAMAALALPVEMSGETRVIRTELSKTSPITDSLAVEQLASGKAVREDYLILSADGESNYFGPRAKVDALHARFGGWSGGGSMSGYWGGYAPQGEVEAFFANAS